MGEARRVGEVVGAAVRRLRAGRGWSQDSLARRIREQGFNTWSRSSVAAVERGGSAIHLSDLVALGAAFGVPLQVLFDDDGYVALSSTFAVDSSVVRALLSGADGSLLEKADRHVLATEEGTAVELSELERRIALRLGVDAAELLQVAADLWGHSPTQERDRRSETRPGAKQHISRELIRELSAALHGSQGGS